MNYDQPYVSIGLPVYNGENYLREAIESILAQSFQDFELIISDNASTDKTSEICQFYAQKDTRIRYVRSERNRGASWNFNYTFELARGKYFKWAAHDDRLHPDFLAKTVAVLDHDPSVVLCFCNAKVIDSQGNGVIDDYDRFAAERNTLLRHVDAVHPIQRFAELLLIEHHCLDAFALMRPEILRQTHLLAPYIASDRVMLAHMGLMGRFHKVPECLFYSRDHAERSIKALHMHQRLPWFDSSKKTKVVFPYWRMLVEHGKNVHQTSLSWGNKLQSYGYLLLYMWRFKHELIRDLGRPIKATLRQYWQRLTATKPIHSLQAQNSNPAQGGNPS